MISLPLFTLRCSLPFRSAFVSVAAIYLRFAVRCSAGCTVRVIAVCLPAWTCLIAVRSARSLR